MAWSQNTLGFDPDTLEPIHDFAGLPRENAERFLLDRYQVTGNHFQGALNTWRNFANKNAPENQDFVLHAQKDEKRAVDVVMKEIRAYGSLKVSFDKEINFRRGGEKKR